MMQMLCFCPFLLLLSAFSTVGYFKCWLFQLFCNWIQFESEKWSRIWSTIVDTEAGSKLLSDWFAASRQTVDSFI